MKRQLPLATASLLAVLSADAAAAEASTACADAALADDLPRARQVCGSRGLDAYNLALLLHGSDPEQAESLLRAAAADGVHAADHVLGNLALDAGDAEDGLTRLSRAARAGLPLAQYDYATALLEVEGPGSAAQVARWYGEAARGGEDAARYNLAALLLSGALGETRPVWAWAWLTSMDRGAADAGHDAVGRLAGELAAQMDAMERQQARAHLGAITEDPVDAARASVLGVPNA